MAAAPHPSQQSPLSQTAALQGDPCRTGPSKGSASRNVVLRRSAFTPRFGSPPERSLARNLQCPFASQTRERREKKEVRRRPAKGLAGGILLQSKHAARRDIMAEAGSGLIRAPGCSYGQQTALVLKCHGGPQEEPSPLFLLSSFYCYISSSFRGKQLLLFSCKCPHRGTDKGLLFVQGRGGDTARSPGNV